MIMNNLYAQKVEVLLKIIPIIAGEECFAIHGGTAINLFVKNLSRYSIGIKDITMRYVKTFAKMLKGIIFYNRDICK